MTAADEPSLAAELEAALEEARTAELTSAAPGDGSPSSAPRSTVRARTSISDGAIGRGDTFPSGGGARGGVVPPDRWSR